MHMTYIGPTFCRHCPGSVLLKALQEMVPVAIDERKADSKAEKLRK